MNTPRQILGTELIPPPWRFLSPDKIIADANLPVAVAQIVAATVQATRLRRSERSELARELCAHFADGLAANVPADQLIKDFGDPKAAARLIARAVKRKRGWFFHAFRRLAQSVAVLLACFLAVYTWYFVQYNFAKPNIARNYVAEFNARVTALPDSQLAWPAYSALLPTWKHLPEPLRDKAPVPGPGAPEWPDYAANLAANAGALETLRTASQLPGLGITLKVNPDPHVAAFLESSGVGKFPTPVVRNSFTPDNPPLIFTVLNEITVMRHFARTLVGDMYLAVEQKDPARINRNAAAILGIARQLREQRVLISDLVSSAIFSLAHTHLGWILHEHAALWSEAQLAELAHILARVPTPGDSFRVRFDTERAQFEDVLQRTFSDDGCGDGVLVASALSYYDDISNYNPQPNPPRSKTLSALVGPAAAGIIAGRREQTRVYNSFIDRTEAVASTPLWQRTGNEQIDVEIDTLVSRGVSRFRYMPLSVLLPALGAASRQGEYIQQQHDAILVAVALELFNRRIGHYPAALSELVPTFLPAVPPDRYSGLPINYILKDNKPLLYSIGVDRVDNQGVPPPGDNGNLFAMRFRSPEYLKSLLLSYPADGKPARDDVRGDWILYPQPKERSLP